MRTYSEFEKKVIIKIINDYYANPSTYVLTNSYNDFFHQFKCEYRKETLVFFRNRNNIDHKELLRLKEYIIQVSLLQKHLIEKQYIYPIKDRNTKTATISDIFDKNDLIGIRVPIPGEISELIEESFCNIVILQPLLDLVANDFKSLEAAQLDIAKQNLEESQKQTKTALNQLAEAQKQTEAAQKQSEAAQQQSKEAKNQTKWSIAAFCLSVISIFLAWFAPIYVARHESVTMDSTQYKRWDSIIISTEQNINKIEKALSERDSIPRDIDTSLNKLKNKTDIQFQKIKESE